MPSLPQKYTVQKLMYIYYIQKFKLEMKLRNEEVFSFDKIKIHTQHCLLAENIFCHILLYLHGRYIFFYVYTFRAIFNAVGFQPR